MNDTRPNPRARWIGDLALLVAGAVSISCSEERGAAGWLHVLADDTLATYRIDSSTGRLGASTTLSVADAQRLASTPSGLVYVAYGARTFPAEASPNAVSAGVRSYSVDPTRGRLVFVTEQPSPVYTERSTRSGTCGWDAFSASARWVFGRWRQDTYHDAYFQVIAHPTTADGLLESGTRPWMILDDNAIGSATPDPGLDVLYQSRDWSLDGSGPIDGGLFADAIGRDRLTQVGSASPCGSQTSGLLIAAGGGLVLAASSFPARTVCSYRAPDLTARGVYVVPGQSPASPSHWGAVAFLPPSSTDGLLVLSGSDPSDDQQSEIASFAVSAAGNVTFRRSIVVPWRTSSLTQLVLHPSGQSLYATDGASLRVYSVHDADGLELEQTLPVGSVRIALTPPPQ